MPRFPDPSQSSQGLSSSVFQALGRRLADHVGPLAPLHVGDTWLEPHESAQPEALAGTELPGLYRYALPHGEACLLDAIETSMARHGGGSVSRDNIQVVSGATVGLSLTCQSLLNPGDEVLIPSPFWPLIRGIVSSRGGVPVEVPFYTRLEEPDFSVEETLAAAVTPRTVAIYLNTPHNPTGCVLEEDHLAAIARVAETHDLWVLSDEVYERLTYDGARYSPVWLREDMRERCIATHSLSKSHGLAGARVGWIHGPSSIMPTIRGVQTHQVYCASRPMQIAASRALNEGEDWLASASESYAAAGRLAAERLGLRAPRAGTFLFLDASPWLNTEDVDALPFLERCLDAGVVLTPGGSCGKDYQRWVRLCFTSVPPGELEAALDRLDSVIA